MYPVVFFDALRVKVRDEGTVKNKAIYLALRPHRCRCCRTFIDMIRLARAASRPGARSYRPPPPSAEIKDLQSAGVVVLGYGSFITTVINFIILAFVIFLMVKFVNKLRAPAAPPEDLVLLSEIRDELKKRG